MKRPSPPRSSDAGYNLVFLMVLLTVLNIAIAASLPAWSGVIRREKEEELVFRGLQYAEAIRVFQNRFQRPPIRLEELVEVEPRSIRQLWKDPMTEKADWKLIPLQGPGGLQVQEPVNPDEQPPEEEGDPEGREGPDDGGFDPGKKEGEIQTGPFKGVHSRSGKTSFLLFNGRDRYDEWYFTIELFLTASGPGGDPERQGPAMNMSARWIGRPLPEFLQPRDGSGLPPEDGGAGFNNPNGRPPGSQGAGAGPGAKPRTTGKP